MVNKKTIGKVQLILGITLIIAVIIGAIYLYGAYNKSKSAFYFPIDGFPSNKTIKGYDNFSNESKLIISYSFTDILAEEYMGLMNILTTCLGSLAVVFILSLILILNGLANIAK